jgi:hypothetical protein
MFHNFTLSWCVYSLYLIANAKYSVWHRVTINADSVGKLSILFVNTFKALNRGHFIDTSYLLVILYEFNEFTSKQISIEL